MNIASLLITVFVFGAASALLIAATAHLRAGERYARETQDEIEACDAKRQQIGRAS